MRDHLPALYSQENTSDPVVHLKFFTPDSGWTWLVTEGQQDGDDFRFFGYVIGLEREWGLLPALATDSRARPLRAARRTRPALLPEALQRGANAMMSTFAFTMVVVVDAERLERDRNPEKTAVRVLADDIRANLESLNAVRKVTVTHVRVPERSP